jgi:hypothetical protein
LTSAGLPYDAAATKLRSELRELFHTPLATLHDGEFDSLARRAFTFQFGSNPAYRAFCKRRGRLPDTLTHWTEIPVVPAAAFKELPLASGDPARAQAVFRTSGTTAGSERRGARHMLDLAMYHAAAVPFFAACMLPDAAALPFLSLMPPARSLPDSSLAHMIDLVMDRLGGTGSRTFADVDTGLDTSTLTKRLADAESSGDAVCLLGTSLAFVNLLQAMDRAGVRVRLPAGSRLMDTGGYKGADQRFDPVELRAWYHDRLALDASHCINEYGMTELCSQFYDDALIRSVRAPDPGDETMRGDGVRPGEARKIGPRWVRSRVVDAVTLEPVARGDVGIVQHFDLANLDAVIAVQTEDLARGVDGGFVLLGRHEDAPPRGCSIAMDELLRAARAR